MNRSQVGWSCPALRPIKGNGAGQDRGAPGGGAPHLPMSLSVAEVAVNQAANLSAPFFYVRSLRSSFLTSGPFQVC